MAVAQEFTVVTVPLGEQRDDCVVFTVEHKPGLVYAFDFPLAQTMVHREGKDLLLTPKDGTPVMLAGFFEINDPDQLPWLFFSDQPLMTAQQFFEMLHVDISRIGQSWETVCLLSGSSSSGCGEYRPVFSSGSGVYSDMAGVLLQGITRLGSLGTDHYQSGGGGGRSLDSALGDVSSLKMGFTGSDPGAGSGNGGGGQKPPPDVNVLFSSHEDALMSAPVRTGTLALPGMPGALYILKDGNGTGKYGMLTLGRDGAWSYARTADLNFMSDGKTYVDTFIVLVTRPDGKIVEKELSVLITGDNDAPVLDNAAAGAEDAAFAVMGLSGHLSGRDTDEGGAVTSFGASGSGARLVQVWNGIVFYSGAYLSDYGELSVAADGRWSFKPVTLEQRANVLKLRAGEQVIITLPITDADQEGALGSAVLTITITGTNQAPEFAAGTLQTATSEDQLMASGRLGGILQVSDAEGDTPVFTAAAIQGLYGAFSLSADGTWSYTRTVDINFMAKGAQYVERFPVTVADGNGGLTQQIFTVVITGDNDAPVIVGSSQGPVDFSAADGAVLSGQVLGTDADMGDSVGSYVVAGAVTATLNGGAVAIGDYGRFVLAGDGSWRLVAETAEQKANMLALESGGRLVLSVPVEAQDSNGAKGGGTLTISVTGDNAAPAFTDTSLSGGMAENALQSAGVLSGTLLAADGNGDALTYSLAGSGAGRYGALSVDANGAWRYVPTMDIDFMAGGEPYVESFLVRVSDGKGGVDTQTLTITITGDNDAPIVQSAAVSRTDSDMSGGAVLSGTISAHDPDMGDAVSAISYNGGAIVATRNGVAVAVSDYGDFFLTADGTWTFQAQSLAQQAKMLSLGVGESLHITVPVEAADTGGETGAGSLTIVIQGGNQAPVFVAESLAKASSEDVLMADPVLRGQLAAQDPDSGDTLFYSLKSGGTGIYGTLSLAADGAWTYTRTADISFLPEGGSYRETFTVMVSDGKGGIAEQPLVLTITGNNDAPVLENAHAAATDAGMAGGLVLAGRITGTDPDAGDAVTGYQTGVIEAKRGNLDVDYREYGELNMDSLGRWTFKAATKSQQEAILSLAEGETLFITVPVSAHDGQHAVSNTGALTITITGTNQAPVLDAASVSDTTHEDVIVAGGSYSGRITAHDPDGGSGLRFSIKPGTGTGVFGDFSMRPDGSWTYTPKTDLNKLVAGQDYVEIFTVLVADEYGLESEQVFRLTITGDNDAPVLENAAASGGDAALASGMAISGRINGSDPENETISYSVGGVSAIRGETAVDYTRYGNLVLGADGGWTFTAESPEQIRNMLSLAKDEVLSIDVTVIGSDPHGASGSGRLTITVTGSNQAPVFDASTLHVSTDENAITGAGECGGSLAATDPDSGAVLAYSVKPGTETGAYGTLTVDSQGLWTYSPTNLEQLAEGQRYTETFTVIVTDEHGAKSEQTFTLEITGRNDAPVLSPASGAGSDARTAAGFGPSGKVNGFDPEGEAVTYTAGAATALLDGAEAVIDDYGVLSMDAQGNWSFNPQTRAQADKLLSLPDGSTLVITVPVTGIDSHGAASAEATLTITINGTDQLPVFDTASLEAGGRENAIQAAVPGYGGRITASDPDFGESEDVSFRSVTENGVYGTFTLNTDGTWRYVPGADMDALAKDQIVTEHFTVTLEDGKGNTVTQTFTLTITGDNDAPVMEPATPGSGTDTAAAGGSGISGVVTGHDPEGDAITYFLAGPAQAYLNGTPVDMDKYGTLVMNGDGTWTFKAVSADQETNLLALADGDSLTVTVLVAGTDTYGYTSDGVPLQIVVSGTNQAPSPVDGTFNVAEHEDVIAADFAAGRSYTGQLEAADPDRGEIPSYSLQGSGDGLYGIFSLATDGSWTYSYKTGVDINSFAKGETYVERFTVLVSNGSAPGVETTFTLSITGDNDAPVLTGVTQGDLRMADPGGAVLAGKVLAEDIDMGDALSYGQAGAIAATVDGGTVTLGKYGVFSLEPDGTWLFSAASPEQKQALEELVQAGKELVLSVPVTVADSHGGQDSGTVRIVVNDTNHAPVFQAVPFVANIGEDALISAGTLGGRVAATDADGQSVTYAVSGSSLGKWGMLTLDAVSGEWLYTLTQDINFMQKGVSFYETFTILASDGQGGAATETLRIEITGDNDKPVLADGGAAGSDADVAGALGLSGIITGMDAEHERIIYGTTSVAATLDGVAVNDPAGYGTFALDSSGNWSFKAVSDVQKANILALKNGQQLVLTVNVSGTDEQSESGSGIVTITVTGGNQGPVFTDDASHPLAVSDSENAIQASPDYAGSLRALDPEGGLVTYSVKESAGLYGALTVDADGTWHYLPGPGFDKLEQGSQYTESFIVVATDSDGGSTEQVFTINISGDNDGPILESAQAPASDVEAASSAGLSGNLAGSDPEGNTFTYSAGTPLVTRGGVPGGELSDYGVLSLDQNGAWSFTAVTAEQKAKLLGLKSGEELEITVPVTGTDSLGMEGAPANLVITVTGTNQAPVFTADSLSAGPAGENALQASGGYSGSLRATDAEDAPTALDYRVVNGAGHYGVFSVDPDGTWHYTPAPGIDALGAGESYTETFTVIVKDSDGAESEAVFSLTISGDNDAPVLGAAFGEATDAYLAGSNALGGSIAGSDPEGDPIVYGYAPEEVRATIDTVAVDLAAYGELSMDAGGNWSFKAVNEDQAKNLLSLPEGKSLVITVPVTGTDPDNASGRNDLIITVTGTNQGPVLADANVSATDAEAAAPLGLSGTLAGYDPDGDLFSYTYNDGAATVLRGGVAVALSDYGNLTVNADGTWNFTAVSPAQQANMLSLKAGETLVITAPITGTDSPGNATGTSVLTITVTGENQGPSFAAGTLGLATSEDAILDTIAGSGSFDGTITADDPDSDPASLSYRIKEGTGTGAYGVFSMQADGVWRYTPTTDLNKLARDTEYKETFTVIVTDEHGAQTEELFTLTIHGDNDAPVLEHSGATASDLDMYQGLVLSGAIPGGDVDMGDTVAYGFGAAEARRDGQTVTLADYGELLSGPGNAWTFEAKTDAQKKKMLGLCENETLVITVPVTGDDGQASDTKNLTITIKGTNQAPVVDNPGCQTAGTEDSLVSAGFSFSGQVTVRDSDEGDTNHTYALVGTSNGLFGSLSIEPHTGAWTYTPFPNLDLNFMSIDKVYLDVFTVRVTDGFGASVEEEICLRITALNDAVVITGTSQGALDLNPFDGTVLSGSILGFDPDEGESGGIVFGLDTGTSIGVTVNGAALPPLLSALAGLVVEVAADGTWHLVAGLGELTALKLLGLDDLLEISVPVKATDIHGVETVTKVVITIGGSNQNPVFDLGTLEKSLGEDALLAAHGTGGTLKAVDPDGQPLSYALAGDGQGLYGRISVSESGVWTYTLTKDINFMAEGRTYTETFRVAVSDGHGGTAVKELVLTIAGNNDAPVFAEASLQAVAMEDALTAMGAVSGQLEAHDPDSGAALSYSLKLGTGTGQYGNFSVTSSGAWTYTPTGNLNGLAEGQSVRETFTAVVSDGLGGFDEKTFTLVIHGENDAPVLYDSTASIINEFLAGLENGLSGTISGTDADMGDAISYTAGIPLAFLNGLPVPLGVYGKFSMQADGTWTLKAETAAQKAALLALGEGQNLVIAVQVFGTDTAGAVDDCLLSLQVSGQKNAPPVTLVRYKEQVSAALVSGNFTVSGATSYTLAGTSSEYGAYITMLMQSDGSYSYAFTPPGEAYFHSLSAGTASVHIPYTVKVTMPDGAVLDRVLDVEVRPTNAGADSLRITAGAVAAGLGLATHNPLDALQSADSNGAVFYLDRSDGLYQGNDTVTIDSGVNNSSVYTYGGNDAISAAGTLSGMLLDAGTGMNTLTIGSLLAAGAGNTVRSAAGTLELNASYTQGGSIYGMSASGGFQNLVGGAAGGSLMEGMATVSSSGGATLAAYALYASGGGNTLRANTVALNATGAGAYGMYAGASGSNTVNGSQITINSMLSGSGAVYGMYASGSGAANTAASASGALTLAIAGSVSGGTQVGGSLGMYAGAAGSNSITGGSGALSSDNISINNGIAAAGGANGILTGSGADSIVVSGGLSASAGGVNSIVSGLGNDSISLSGDLAAFSGGKNSIDMGTGSDSLRVTGNLSATGTGSANTITGSSASGVPGTWDSISIYGNISGSSGGTNSITTGTGNDFVNICGQISGSGAVISTSAGNDTIRIDGSVATGSLKIQAGAGNDVLVLSVPTKLGLDFEKNYLPWLKDMLNNTDHGIESIVVEGLDLSALLSLTLFLATYNLSHPHVELAVAPLPLLAGAEPLAVNLAAVSPAEAEVFQNAPVEERAAFMEALLHPAELEAVAEHNDAPADESMDPDQVPDTANAVEAWVFALPVEEAPLLPPPPQMQAEEEAAGAPATVLDPDAVFAGGAADGIEAGTWAEHGFSAMLSLLSAEEEPLALAFEAGGEAVPFLDDGSLPSDVSAWYTMESAAPVSGGLSGLYAYTVGGRLEGAAMEEGGSAEATAVLAEELYVDDVFYAPPAPDSPLGEEADILAAQLLAHSV